jgi:O-methyltransferase
MSAPASRAKQIAHSHSLVSDQVTVQQVELVIGELERVIDNKVVGDIVEFGCYIGTTSVFIQRLIVSTSENRAFHVYDSFEGLPEKSTQDSSSVGEAFTAGELAVSKKRFMQTFARSGVTTPTVHKGWFKQLGANDVPKNIAFAFLDGDFYESIEDSLRLVVPRISRGGTIVVDDYAREALPGVAKAVHKYFPADRVRTAHNMGVIRL